MGERYKKPSLILGVCFIINVLCNVTLLPTQAEPSVNKARSSGHRDSGENHTNTARTKPRAHSVRTLFGSTLNV